MNLGIDTSTYFEVLEKNIKYYKNNVEVDPLKEFRKNGVKYFRIRLWNNPYSLDGKPYLGGTCDLANFIKLSKLALSLGYEILLDFHFSDFWVDAGKQFLPKAWEGLSYNELKLELKNYVFDTLTKIKNEGINIAQIQIGNEITNGFLWPYGKLTDGNPRGNYDRYTELLNIGIAEAKRVYNDAKIIIHLERSYDTNVYFEVFDNLEKYNVKYDVIGMSYYPYWHKGFKEFFSNVDKVYEKYHKEIMVMELAYAYTLEDYNKNVVSGMVVNKNNVSTFPYLEFPITKEGQKEFVKTFIDLANNHHISTIYYWEPIWLPGDGICWASEEALKYIHEEGKQTRNEWANQALFDYEGNMNIAFDAFKVN